MTQGIRIASGNSVCTLLPEAGGSIGSWSIEGQDMLRAALAENDPLQSASFPLVPYSNRIADAQFDWAGERIALRPHPIALPHAIHGIGWRREWDVERVAHDMAVMKLRHQPDADWPWPIYAQQRIRIGPFSLELQLSSPCIADEVVPLAFGHHCYFDSADARLQFRAERFYPNGPDMLPLDPVTVGADTNFTFSRRLADCDFDNIFGGWDGKARIEWAGRGYALAIESDMRNVVLFTPRGEEFFCFEPVPHINNALNRADGDMPRIAPGGVYQSHIRFFAIAA